MLYPRSPKQDTSSNPSRRGGGGGVLKRFFRRFSSALLLSSPKASHSSTLLKAAVVVATASLASVSAVGLARLRQEFDPMWFLPSDSYLAQWVEANDR